MTPMSTRRIATGGQAASCYFRTTVAGDSRKALVQITEVCNLKCAHCFVSAGPYGDTMPLEQIRERVVPQLAEAGVIRATLTGGEPFAHPELLDVVAAFHDARIGVGLCTNATLATGEQIRGLAEMDVHVNVSLDGFAADSHGKFRGDRDSFATTVDTVRRFAAAGILQGLLCTPNSLAEDDEYAELCAFAAEQGARYVLMNPLSSMGRGVKSRRKLASPAQHMRRIQALTEPYADESLELVRIRFPNDSKPLAGCEAGTIIYVFTAGEVTVCPYLVFAARTPQSQHADTEFIVGNVWEHDDIAARLEAYRFADRYTVGDNPACGACPMSSGCGKGCPAAVVAAGKRIGDLDGEVCPVAPTHETISGTAPQRPLLPVTPI